MKLCKLTTFLTVLVLTFSGCVESTPSPSSITIIDPTLPVIELTNNGTFVDMKAVGFEWKNITDPRVKGVFIYKQTVGKESGNHTHVKTIKSRFVTHYIDEDVEPGTQYSYFFKTYTKKSESKSTSAKVVSTLPVLDSVSWIHAVQEMPRSAKIMWRPHSNQIVKSYILERKTLLEDEWKELKVIEGRLNIEYIDDDLKDNFVYKYRVRVNTYNDLTSAPSAEVKVITKALPKTVMNMTASTKLPKRIEIKWARIKMKDFSHFNVYRAEHIDGSYDLVSKTKENQYIDTIKEDGKDYFYRVSSVDKDSLESKYEAESVHGRTLIKPTTPALVEVKMLNNKLVLDWKATDNRVSSYIVNKTAKNSWFDTVKEEFVNIKSTEFVDAAISPETTYLYQITSVDKFSVRSEPSEEVKYTTAKNEGVTPAENPTESIEVIKSSRKSTQRKKSTQNVVEPMEYINMSDL
ncbi:fibronectin type III domain-containing protein [Sulfurimonas sp. SAG-AH-194-I05]|nr:hypothetical protein [Sulfurimonas sp. SAG-AH-194-I05]MDF1875417.1 fibronectin type III domain-containing protein [Sulfurimonas sp. SAG-AH-194-I05]